LVTQNEIDMNDNHGLAPYTEEEKKRIEEKNRAEGSLSRVQGIGTAYYGKKDIRPDRSYIATEWFVLLLLPVCPLGSYRLIKTQQQSRSYVVVHSSTVSYKVLERIPLKNNISQIVRTYLFTYGGIALVVGSFFLASINIIFIWLSFVMIVALLILALVYSE
jgi:hypothetical protein